MIKTIKNAPAAILGEGAIWHPDEQVLYWIDITGKKLHRYDPEKNDNTTLEMDGMIGTVIPDYGKYSVVVALETGIKGVLPDGSMELLAAYPANEPSGNRFNDGKCDPAGRFWVGTMSKKETKGAGNLYCFDGKDLVLKESPVSISNGIAWSKDGKTMYYIDTPEQVVFAYDFDLATGNIKNRRIAFKVPEINGYPDGMTIDSDGNLWIAHWNGAAVICYDPHTGKEMHKIKVRALNVTSCSFGGKDLKTLYITSARQGLTEQQLKEYPLSGKLFSVECDSKGIPAYSFEMK